MPKIPPPPTVEPQVVDLARMTSAQEPTPPEPDVVTLDDLPLDEDTRAQLDSLCTSYRQVHTEMGKLENTKDAVMKVLKPLAESLSLPRRVLGAKWDLRKTVRVTKKVNEDRLKMALLHAGFTLPQTCIRCEGHGVLATDPAVVVCPVCAGNKVVIVEGLPAVLALIEQVSDTSESVSWSVYGREEKKAKGGGEQMPDDRTHGDPS